MKFAIFQEEDDKSEFSDQWIAVETTDIKNKYLSGIGNTPAIALLELQFAIENCKNLREDKAVKGE